MSIRMQERNAGTLNRNSHDQNKPSNHTIPIEFMPHNTGPDESSRIFHLHYDPEMTLTPDTDTVTMAMAVARTLPPRARVLELGCGSAIWNTSLILGSQQNQITEIVSTDIDPRALAIAEHNIESACLSKNENPSRIFQISDWLKNIHGIFDLIYANPPYLMYAERQLVGPYAQNPAGTLYVPRDQETAFHYIQIIDNLVPHIQMRSQVILRVPRTEWKAQSIVQAIKNRINPKMVKISDSFNSAEMREKCPNARFISVQFL